MGIAKALICIILLGSCLQATAGQSHIIRIDINEPTLVQITNLGKQLEVTVISDDGEPLEIRNFSQHYSTLLFTLKPGASATSRNYTIYAKHQAFIKSDTPQVSVLTQATNKSIEAVRQANTLLTELDKNGFDQAIYSQLIELGQQFANSPKVANYLYQQLTFIALANSKIDQAFGHLKNIYAEMDVSIPLYCSVLNKSLIKQESLSTRHLIAMGKLSQLLIESQRQYREILGRVTQQAYTEICKPIFVQLEQRFPELRPSESFAPLQDAETLLNAMHLSDKAETQLARALIAEYSWFLFNYKNQYEQAENFARQAINLYKTLPDNAEALAKLYSMLSSSLVRRGYYGEAHRLLRRGLTLKEHISASQYSILLYNKGFFYKDLGEWELAFDYLNQALKVLWQNNGYNSDYIFENCIIPESHQQLLVNNLNQLGSVRQAQERFDDAKTLHQCALKFATQIGVSRKYSIVTQLARVQLASGEIAAAKAELDKLTKIKKPSEPERISALLTLIELAIAQNDHHNIMIYLKEIVEYLGYENTYNDDLLDISSDRHLNEQIKLFRLLVAYHLKLRKITDSPFSTEHNEQWLSLFTQKALQVISTQQVRLSNPQRLNFAKYEFAKTYLDTLAGSLENLNQEQIQEIYFILEAFYTLPLHAEKNLFNASVENSDKSSQLLQHFNKWHKLLRKYLLAPQNHKSEIKPALDEAEQTFIDFNISVPRATTVANPPRSLQQIQQSLSENDIILRYFIGGHTAYVLVVTPTSMEINIIPPKQELEPLITQLREEILLGKSVIDLSHQIAKQVLPPQILSGNNPNTVILILDDVLHQLPFSALNIASKENRYIPLTSKYELLRTYSLEEFFDARRKQDTDMATQPRDNLSISVFASPTTYMATDNQTPSSSDTPALRIDLNYARLQGAILESTYIAEIFAKKNVRIAIEDQATRRFLMSENSRNATILHIATHGAFQPEHPEIVGLLASSYGDDSATLADVLSLSELLSAEVRNSLVVLSGCSTMSGRLYKATGMRSMTRGYLVQGAGAVIGTLWPVQDYPTSQFMRYFYLRLSETNDVTKSLQLSQIHFARSGRFRHPRFWAGFVPTLSNSKFKYVNL